MSSQTLMIFLKLSSWVHNLFRKSDLYSPTFAPFIVKIISPPSIFCPSKTPISFGPPLCTCIKWIPTLNPNLPNQLSLFCLFGILEFSISCIISIFSRFCITIVILIIFYIFSQGFILTTSHLTLSGFNNSSNLYNPGTSLL